MSCNLSTSARMRCPYVGPRPFTSRDPLSGRRREVRELRSLLVAERVVLLHAPSGAGKTSLLEAHGGLKHALSDQYHVYPTIRVGQPVPGELSRGGPTVNRYGFSVLRSLEEAPGPGGPLLATELVGLSMAAYLERRRPELAPQGERTDRPRRELLIFDQFEEVLTADPRDEAGRGEFFAALAEVLAERRLWVLFVVREDYLGGLHPWIQRLPTQLARRFRIDLLGEEGAREAIRAPAEELGVRFEPDALNHLVRELQQVQVQGLDGALERGTGLWVEPVQLQVVCRRLWSRLAPDQAIVTRAEVQQLGEVDAALAEFYAEQVEALAAAMDLPERHLRDWVGSRLISPQGTRTPVMRGLDMSDGLANLAIDALESAHLVRSEERRGVKWYELAHDRLVAPVRDDNAAWEVRHLHAMQLQAALWQRRGEPADLLLTDETLPAAEAWAAEHREALTRAEVQYLERSRERAATRASARAAESRLAAEQARRLRLLLIGAAMLVVAAMLVIAALGWGLRARAEAAEREQLARRFTEMVEQVDSLARQSALAPLHDIRGEQQAIRDRIAGLEAEIARAGPIAVGSGRYAQGRGYMALGEHDRALAALDEAWQGGFREPRAAYALALVHGHLYQQGLREAEKIESVKLREATIQALERRHRDPALAYLENDAAAEVPSPAFVAALVAFYEGHLEEALGQLDAIGEALPWFYEAPALRGEILVTRAAQRWSRGDAEGAQADLAAGRLAYAQAAAIGESVPAVLTAMGELEYTALRITLYGQGDARPPFERGEQAVRRALQAAPDDPAALLLDARLRRRMAEYSARSGEPVEGLLGAAADAVERALVLAPGQARARLELARVHRQWGNVRQRRGEDPREHLGRALAAVEGLAPEARDLEYHQEVGLVHQTWAYYDEQIGADPLAHLDLAIESFRAALRLDDQDFGDWYSLGSAYFQRAANPRAADPDADAAQALAAFDAARTRNPATFTPYLLGGQIHHLLAGRRRARGEAARPELDAALEQYERGLQLNANLVLFHTAIGAALLDVARDDWDHGGDPEPQLARARAAFERAIAAAPEVGDGYHNVGEVLVQRAGYTRERGEDPGAAVREALAAIQTARERLGDDPLVLANLGTVHAIQAAHTLEQGRDPRVSLDAAESALAAALVGNPGHAPTHLVLGETHAIRARWSGSADEFQAATAAYQRAAELAPDMHEYTVAFAHACRAWAAKQRDPAAPLTRGLELAERVVAARPDWADARLVRGSLRLLQAELTGDPAERRTLAGLAAADLVDALTRNRNRERVWRPQATRAQALASGSDRGP